jgi:hypothetical protein
MINCLKKHDKTFQTKGRIRLYPIFIRFFRVKGLR